MLKKKQTAFTGTALHFKTYWIMATTAERSEFCCFTFIFLLTVLPGWLYWWKEHSHSRRSQCNVSHQTGESRKTVDAHIIKEHSGKASGAKSSPSAPLTPSSRQGPHTTVFNTKGKIKLKLYQIFFLAQYFITFTLYFSSLSFTPSIYLHIKFLSRQLVKSKCSLFFNINN